ncbi:MAG: hypothetical protein J6V68_02545 [Clostridia bacterium]|nr:hypothetical protein [Clostridia bacterium]
MIKKAIKSIILVLAIIASSLLFVACDEPTTTAVTLKTPGAVLNNGGSVIETENYFYYVNGMGISTDANDYGTPIKGSIAVVAKSDMTKSEIVVPKLVSAKDYNAGIYLYGQYLYYGTTTTKKGTDGKIATDHLEFQKAKIDGSGVEEILTIKGLDTPFRFFEANGKVYLVYQTTVTENGESKAVLISRDVATGAEKVIAKDYTSYMFLSNDAMNEGATVSVLFTKEVKKYPTLTDNDEIADYNELYAYKVGEAQAKLLRSGSTEKTGKVNPVTYSIVSFIGNGVVLTTNESANTVKAENHEYINLDTLYTSTVDTQKTIVGEVLKDITNINGLVKSVNEIYYFNSELGFIYKSDATKDASEAYPVAKASVDTLIGEYDGYIYYFDSESFVRSVEIDAEDVHDENVIVEKSASSDWYDVEILDGKLFFKGPTDLDRGYIRFVDLDAIDYDADFTEEEGEDVTYMIMDQTKVQEIGKYTDEDVAKMFEAKLVEYRDNALQSSDMRVDVREDDGSLIVINAKIDGVTQDWVTTEDFVELAKAYDALTSAQKEYLGDEAVKAYDKYIRCVKMNTLLAKLEGFNEAQKAGLDETAENAWKAIATTVKNQMQAWLTASDYIDVENMADNNLLWEYWGGDDTKGALEYFFAD